MHVLFEEDGGFKAGSILDAHGADATSFQVELATGRRLKIKASAVVLKFETPAADELLPAAQAMADEIDLDFLWEVAPQDEFDVSALGAEYFGGKLSPVQYAALLLRVHASPMYFRRKGKGRYRPAPESELKAAIAGQERKRIAAEKQAELARELVAGKLPPDWGVQPDQDPALVRAAFLLFKPDKNAMEWKALDAAAHDAHMTQENLLLRAGAFASVKDLHRGRFLVEWFPRGTGFGSFDLPAGTAEIADSLPIADVQAFSIDDSQTTEIDDALSVQYLDGGNTVRIGVHIAAPGLAIRPGDALDTMARKRMSTVYMPGEKITMLPDALVEVFTLGAGTARPALSLYGDFDPATGECRSTRTVVERVPIAANLRHDQLDSLITEVTLQDDHTEFPFKRELKTLARIGDRLAADREIIRGKPEPRNRTDYNFRVLNEDGVERIVIDQRKRDAPLDRIVAEWMIFANSGWGRLLDEAGVPGIYRVQTSFGRPGVRQSSVRMQTHAAQHIGIGVKHYAWSSSPLRRYVDLVNQWQILAVARGEPAPFAKNSAELFATIGAFDAAYAAYASVQSALERYWCLRWLAQEGLVNGGNGMDAIVLRNENVRLVALPLALPLTGIGHLPPGTRVEIDVIATDETALTIEARLAAVHAEEMPADVEAMEEEELPDSPEAIAAEAEGEAAVVGADGAGGEDDAAADATDGAPGGADDDAARDTNATAAP